RSGQGIKIFRAGRGAGRPGETSDRPDAIILETRGVPSLGEEPGEMTTFRTLLAALLLAGLLPGFQSPPPQDEYKTKLVTLSKSTAAKHYAVADYLAGAQMFLWAREQLYKTIEFDPDHEGARKRLGYKKGDDG